MTPRVGDRIGRYRLDRELGRGGMGVVYAATDTGLGRTVAVKLMSGALGDAGRFRARFDREASTLARLDSPHVIDIHDHGEHPLDGGRTAPYLVTRLVPGGDLGGLLARRGPLPPRLAASICAQVAEALRDAHAAGVVHRDVKPGNVLLRDPDAAEPFAYLCDFGIATVTDHDATSATRTGAGVTGTWTYLSPERIDGGPGTPSSDLYAVGCLLWACLTGGPPYTGSDWAVADAHHRAPLPQLGSGDPTSRGLDRVLAATLAKDPSTRIGDAEQLRVMLQSVADGTVGPPASYGGASGLRGAPAPAGRARLRRGRALLAAAAAIVLVAGVGAAAYWWPAEDRTNVSDPTDPDPTDSTTGAATEDPEPESAGADLNGDGLGDLLVQVGRSSDAQRLTWLSDGTELVGPNVAAGTRGVPLRGDLDGDGSPDVVVVSRDDAGAARIAVELAGGETQERSVPPLALREVATLVGDIDGDGLDDLGFWGLDSSEQLRFSWLQSTGDGEFGERAELTLPELDGGSLQPGDFDGDGRLDLAHLAGDDGAATVQVLVREDEEFVAASDPGDSLGPAELLLSRTADVDGDGVEELVQISTTEERRLVEVWRYDAGGLTRAIWFDGPSQEGSALQVTPAVADVDGDGADDLVTWRLVSGTTLGLDVLRSTGSAYEEGAEWARWDCSPICFRPLTVVAPYI